MTTYILHGGSANDISADNDLFLRQFTHHVKKSSIHILMCYFTQEPNTWQECLQRDKAKILKYTSKKVTFTIANDSNDLLKKIKTHDVLYVAGGNPVPVESALPQLSKLVNYLDGKVYIGSSMGAYIISKKYVLGGDGKNLTDVHTGLGILPINILCHWKVEDKRMIKLKSLREDEPDVPVLTLSDGKFVVMYF